MRPCSIQQAQTLALHIPNILQTKPNKLYCSLIYVDSNNWAIFFRSIHTYTYFRQPSGMGRVFRHRLSAFVRNESVSLIQNVNAGIRAYGRMK